jgi:hypothetical protein
MTAVGLAAVSARRFLRKKSFDGRLVGALPAASAALILALGLAMTTRALPGVL